MLDSWNAAKMASRPHTHLIEVRIRELQQLFNSMDPTPFHHQDLDPDAEEFIVGWALEHPAEGAIGHASAFALASILKESLTIGGWVAMWRPLEIFLYDWWPLTARRRVLRKLSAAPVKLKLPRPAA